MALNGLGLIFLPEEIVWHLLPYTFEDEKGFKALFKTCKITHGWVINFLKWNAEKIHAEALVNCSTSEWDLRICILGNNASFDTSSDCYKFTIKASKIAEELGVIHLDKNLIYHSEIPLLREKVAAGAAVQDEALCKVWERTIPELDTARPRFDLSKIKTASDIRGWMQPDYMRREFKFLTQIPRFGLAGLSLKALPKEISHFKNIDNLDLSNNQLTELPDEIWKITTLHYLYFSNNQLKILSGKIGQLKNLLHLSLSNNQLTALPTEICELKNLRRLNLSGNPHLVLSLEIGRLKFLDYLTLRDGTCINLPQDTAEGERYTTVSEAILASNLAVANATGGHEQHSKPNEQAGIQ